MSDFAAVHAQGKQAQGKVQLQCNFNCSYVIEKMATFAEI